VEPRAVVALLLCGIALVLARPQVAMGGWPLGAPARVTVPFGAVYGADGDTSRHRGTDLEAAPGASVLAPLAGKVTFAGKVPAVGGGRVLAITLETAAGNVTLLPLARAEVARGASVAENTPLGTIATDGDGSSDLTHLHVGLRKGDMYVDPLSVMAPPAVSDSGNGSGEPVGAGVEAGAGVTAGSGVSAGVSSGVSGLPGGVSLAPKGAGAGDAIGDLSAAGAGMGSGVTLAVPGGSHAAASVRGAATAGESAADAVAGAVRHAATRAGGRSSDARSTRDAARDQALEAVSAGLSALASKARGAAVQGARLGLYAALGVLGGIATLSPLWRGARKGLGKVSVSALEDDVVAAPSR
jgi:hypothetical protein